MQPTHSLNEKTLYVLLEWIFYYILWDIQGMLERGEEEKRKIYEAPPKSQYGFQVTLL